MAIKYTNATRGLWVRSGGAWVPLTEASATAMLYDVLGTTNNKAWQVYVRTGYNPVSGVTTWTHILSTDKNGPGSVQPASATLGVSQFSGLPDLRKTQLTWTEAAGGAGGGFDLEIFFQNFNDSSFNFTTTLGAGRNGATGILCNPAGHTGNAVQAHLTYVDVDGFRGPTTHSNTLTL